MNFNVNKSLCLCLIVCLVERGVCIISFTEDFNEKEICYFNQKCSVASEGFNIQEYSLDTIKKPTDAQNNYYATSDEPLSIPSFRITCMRSEKYTLIKDTVIKLKTYGDKKSTTSSFYLHLRIVHLNNSGNYDEVTENFTNSEPQWSYLTLQTKDDGDFAIEIEYLKTNDTQLFGIDYISVTDPSTTTTEGSTSVTTSEEPTTTTPDGLSTTTTIPTSGPPTTTTEGHSTPTSGPPTTTTELPATDPILSPTPPKESMNALPIVLASLSGVVLICGGGVLIVFLYKFICSASATTPGKQVLSSSLPDVEKPLPRLGKHNRAHPNLSKMLSRASVYYK